jgi:hypothetical protein
MKILTKVAIVLRGGRNCPANSVVCVPDQHAEALIKNGSAVPIPRRYLKITGLAPDIGTAGRGKPNV